MLIFSTVSAISILSLKEKYRKTAVEAAKANIVETFGNKVYNARNVFLKMWPNSARTKIIRKALELCSERNIKAIHAIV